MSSITIQNAFDITAARNQLRQKIVGSNWTPVFRARAATALTALGELILRLRQPTVVDVSVVMGHGTWGVKISCNLSQAEELGPGAIREKLGPLTDEVEIGDGNAGATHVSASIWLTKGKTSV